jgi:hypothetical protein
MDNEDTSSNAPDDFGSDLDVPVVHIPPPEHPHHPTVDALHNHYVARSVDFIRKHWPTASAVNAFSSLVTALAAVMMVIVYVQISGIMKSQGGQTDQLIDAANTQARASRRIALAARIQGRAASYFSESADQIRQQTEKAVSELERTASDSERAISETSKNAQRALQSSIDLAAEDRRPGSGYRSNARRATTSPVTEDSQYKSRE